MATGAASTDARILDAIDLLNDKVQDATLRHALATNATAIAGAVVPTHWTTPSAY